MIAAPTFELVVSIERFDHEFFWNLTEDKSQRQAKQSKSGICLMSGHF